MTIKKNQKYQSNSDIISLLQRCALLDEFMQTGDEFLSLLEEIPEDSGSLSEEELLWAAGGVSRPRQSPDEDHS